MKNKLTGEDGDLIFKNKTFIAELTNVQTMYFDFLCDQLELNDRGNDHMFDYIFNDHGEIGFDEYLGKYGINEEEIFEKSKRKV